MKALNVAPEAQVVLARDEVWSRSLQSGGMKGPGGKYTMGSLWKPSRFFNLPVTLPAKTGQTNLSSPLRIHSDISCNSPKDVYLGM